MQSQVWVGLWVECGRSVGVAQQRACLPLHLYLSAVVVPPPPIHIQKLEVLAHNCIFTTALGK